MGNSRLLDKKVLVFFMLCSVGMVLLWQWQGETYSIRKFVNPGYLNQSVYKLPQKAVNHKDDISNREPSVNGNNVKPYEVIGMSTVSPKLLAKSGNTAASANSSKSGAANSPRKPVSTNSPVSTKSPSKKPATTTKPPKQPVLTTPSPNKCNDTFRDVYVKKKDFICCHPIGGLGNNMFIYASAYGIAAKLNRTLVVSNKISLTTLFSLSAHVVSDYECVIKGSSGKGANIDCGFDKMMFSIPKGQNYCVGAYLQSFKYFDHVKDAIKRQFIFRKEIRDQAMQVVHSAVGSHGGKSTDSKPRILVGVHVRRGDFVNHAYGYDVVTAEYLHKAMTYFRTMYANVLFLVCSNGMDWSKKNIKGDDVFFVSGHSYEVDMAVLVSCNHTVTSTGSFSWWAGYLTGGEVIYYHWPAKEDTGLRKHFRYDDYFLPSWIGMR